VDHADIEQALCAPPIACADLALDEEVIALPDMAKTIEHLSGVSAAAFDGAEARDCSIDRSANLPSASLTPAFEAFLKSEGIIPGYV
jgi:hypothetical protein